jgi:transcriptional regulator with XRE-family HTH domain
MGKKKNLEKWFRGLLEEYKDDVEFITEGIVLELNEKIISTMEDLKISRTELARKLGVTKAFVTKLLNGNHNLTIKTIVSIAKALESELILDLCHKGFEQKRIIYYKSTRPQELNAYKTPIKPELEFEEDQYASVA